MALIAALHEDALGSSDKAPEDGGRNSCGGWLDSVVGRGVGVWNRRCVWVVMRGTSLRTDQLKSEQVLWRNGDPCESCWVHHGSRGNCA